MQNCMDCQKKNKWRNTGRRDERGAIIRQCTNCGFYQSEPPPQAQGLEKEIFYYDIENTKIHIELDTFQLKQQSDYLSWKTITRASFLLCWSGAWITPTTTADNLKIISDSITPAEARAGYDKRSLDLLSDCINRADRLSGHNVKAFDTKKVMTRLILNHMQCIDLSVKHIDTLSIVKKYFKNDSNALGYWVERLGHIGKDKITSEDWDLCRDGDQKALNKMQRYNKRDVQGGVILLLELRDFLLSGGVNIFK